jgi:undecaprenyl-diphosphatase
MQFSLWQVIVLAVVQGIAEFLPISSSGHLVVLAPLLFGGSANPPKMLDLSIVLHLGTLGSILVYYRARIWRLLGADRNTLGLLFIATLPAVVIGLSIKRWYGDALESPLVAGCMFPITGLAILWSLRLPAGTREYQQLGWRRALVIGCSQAAAILPGLSRSGSTIAAGLGVGLTRPSAATFSFLMAIPAIGGAGVLEAASMIRDGESLSTPVGSLVIGALVSFVVGLGAIALLERLLVRGQLRWFAWYCIVLGAVVLVWQLLLR